jgi:7-cyano-7-deazaguanine reductase
VQLLIPGNIFYTARVFPEAFRGWFLGASTEWPGAEPADVELGDVDSMAEKYPARPMICADSKKVGAIDLNRLQTNVDIAVAKSRSASRLTLLGRSEARLPASPAEARLETFPNPVPSRNYRIHFETDDFTSVCPITGQPDFARIDIDYVPDQLCLESKSLKFYLASYRNERAFNEAVTNRILDDFVKACAPREAIVTAQFSARGGIALTVRAEYPEKAKNARDGR